MSVGACSYKFMNSEKKVIIDIACFRGGPCFVLIPIAFGVDALGSRGELKSDRVWGI